MKKLRFTKVRDVRSPEYGTPGSAGLDFFVPNDESSYMLLPGADVLIPSGIIADIPDGYMLLGADKSGVATSYGACVNAGRQPKPDAGKSPIIIGAKIIDSDYQGEIWMHLINIGLRPVRIKPGQKVTQFILVPVEQAELVEVEKSELFDRETTRGTGGFGSTNN